MAAWFRAAAKSKLGFPEVRFGGLAWKHMMLLRNLCVNEVWLSNERAFGAVNFSYKT